MAKIGDTVRFLNSVGGGKVVRIDGNMAYVEDEDGFEVPAMMRECVVVMEASAAPKPESKPAVEFGAKSKPQAVTPSKDVTLPAPDPLPIEETEGGNRINAILAFEPSDLMQISKSTFEATLVNDSNYFLSFVFATRSDDSDSWTLQRAAVVEPNIMLSLGEYTTESLNELSHIMFQYVAFKDGKEFAAKKPGSVELNVDVTKFCKFHCFRSNEYFDEAVLAFDLITNDVPYSPTKVDAHELEHQLRKKKAADARPKVRPIKKKHPRNNDIIEVDLHINELVDNTNGLSRGDMINLQIDEFRRVMDANLKNHGQKIVFIHGKGEGILRQAILKELGYKYKGHDVCDASFREYGFGATQVTIR